MKFQSLQMLRGIAAMWVVAYHMQDHFDPLATAFPLSASDLLRKGYIGVDLFFVISGFVIAWTALYKPGPHDAPIKFLLKRLIRVAPPYWIATLYFAMLGDLSKIELEPILRSLFFIPIESNYPPIYGFPILLIGWSLNYEVYFYLSFSALLCLGRRLSIQITYFAITLVILPAIFSGKFSIDPEHLYKGISNTYILLATNPIILEFVFGMVLARLYGSLPGTLRRSYVWLVLCASIVIFMAAFFLYEPRMSILFRGLPCACLVAGFLVVERYQLFSISRHLAYFGEMSYSIYLTHPFVLVVAKSIYATTPGQHYVQIAQYLLALAVALGFARFFYKYVEQPMLQHGKRIGSGHFHTPQSAKNSTVSRVK
ncbi:acyltransferase family protein [Cupriavidus taiwanensis]|uniref:acyltransferase family protein n=1 Tax=Cupriavidus taiwanensis TaxID=164546 RepID=UPI000E1FEBDD|nr:acyltransferase [Cupriavidus taiwanensis]